MKRLALGFAAVAIATVSTVALQAQQKEVKIPPTLHKQMQLFQMKNYNGDSKTVQEMNSQVYTDWNIKSIAIHPGDKWQICMKPRYKEPCIILDRSVADASVIGIEGQIGSARPAPAGN